LTSNAKPRTLVLSPHPDDESLACGGTLKLITSGGGPVDILYMTSGERGFFPNVQPTPDQMTEMAARRQVEARGACRILGVEKVAFLPGPDGMVQAHPELAEPVLAAFKAHHYRSVFCPWPFDGHPDHAATYWIMHSALARYAQEMEVWLYEVWTPLAANRFICIDSTIDAKMEAFKAHASQSSLLNYAEAFRGLARYRSLFCPPARYAEAFYNCDSSRLLKQEGLPWGSAVLPAQR
jgi:N-acetylglucosamine malate deacetylase 1